VVDALCRRRPALPVASLAKGRLLALELAENPPAVVVAPVARLIALGAPSAIIIVALSAYLFHCIGWEKRKGSPIGLPRECVGRFSGGTPYPFFENRFQIIQSTERRSLLVAECCSA